VVSFRAGQILDKFSFILRRSMSFLENFSELADFSKPSRERLAQDINDMGNLTGKCLKELSVFSRETSKYCKFIAKIFNTDYPNPETSDEIYQETSSSLHPFICLIPLSDPSEPGPPPSYIAPELEKLQKSAANLISTVRALGRNWSMMDYDLHVFQKDDEGYLDDENVECWVLTLSRALKKAVDGLEIIREVLNQCSVGSYRSVYRSDCEEVLCY